MGARTGLDSLKRMASMLTQTMQFGTPLSDGLRVLSMELRQEMMVRFEARAARLPVLLTAADDRLHPSLHLPDRRRARRHSGASQLPALTGQIKMIRHPSVALLFLALASCSGTPQLAVRETPQAPLAALAPDAAFGRELAGRWGAGHRAAGDAGAGGAGPRPTSAAQDRRGDALVALGRPAEAQAAYQAALAAKPNDPDAQVGLGRAAAGDGAGRGRADLRPGRRHRPA